tara:strand:+ start:74 stop:1417 length:1344 start_codon:yes stop_codon:yes gene_type:complete
MIGFNQGHVEVVFTDPNDDNFLLQETFETGKILFTPYNNESDPTLLSAIPLLRGVQDSITRGDLILYTTIGNKTFYLGPINTRNIPSNSSDHLYRRRERKDRPDGYNRFIPKTNTGKLSKLRNKILDFPAISEFIKENNPSYYESNITDLMLEGRYGNAIRIGNRHQNPHLFISNNNSGDTELLSNGSSGIFMLSLGRIDDNFPNETHVEIRNNEEVFEPGYRLSADPDKNTIGFGNDEVNADKPENKFNYEYGFIKNYNPEEPVTPNNEFDQIIITSDRIIFDSTVEDITVSANRNINLGSNKNFTLNNKGFSVFQSQNIYIGEAAKRREQPMVLGNELQQLLIKILRLLGNAHALGDMNVPQLLTLQSGEKPAGSTHVAGTLRTEVSNIMQEFFNIDFQAGDTAPADFNKNLNDDGTAVSDRISGNAKFLSDRHFVEPNRIESEE